MVQVTRTAFVGLVLTMAACGGDGNDREAFTRDANKACRDLKREFAAVPEDERYGESTRLYERELKRLQAIKPPDDLRARYNEMLRYKKEGLDAWREFVEHADKQDFKGGQPASDRATLTLVRAARIGSELHLADCDRALS